MIFSILLSVGLTLATPTLPPKNLNSNECTKWVWVEKDGIQYVVPNILINKNNYCSHPFKRKVPHNTQG